MQERWRTATVKRKHHGSKYNSGKNKWNLENYIEGSDTLTPSKNFLISAIHLLLWTSSSLLPYLPSFHFPTSPFSYHSSSILPPSIFLNKKHIKHLVASYCLQSFVSLRYLLQPPPHLIYIMKQSCGTSFSGFTILSLINHLT